MNGMFNMLVIMFFIAVFFLFVILILLIFHKVFKKINIEEIEFPEVFFAYQVHKGDYKNNMKVMEKLLKTIQDYPIKVSKPMIIYYDNPNKVKKTELKSEIGFVISGIGEIKEQLPFEIKKIAFSKCLSSQFPYKSRFSIVIGASKVFNALKKHTQKMNVEEREIIEIYNIKDKEILYYMPVD